MKKICAALFVLAAATSTSAFAKGCATPKGAFDQVYCAGNEFNKADTELNKTYGLLKKKLSKSDQETLRQEQLAWIKDRNDECSYEKPSGYFVNLDCANRMTEERVDELKSRLR